MADLAFDPNAPPEYDAPVAQAPLPEPSPFQQLPPQQAAPPTAPPPPPTGQGDQGVQTGAPPQQAPQPPPSPPPTLPSDADDMQQQQAADQEEQQQYQTRRSHHGNYEILKDAVDPTQNPNFPKYQRALELYTQLPKAERPAFKPLVDGLKAQILNDTKAANAKVRDQQKVEAAQADAPYENSAQRIRTGDTIGGLVGDIASDYTDRSKDRDPKLAQQSDFTIKTSPLTTMSIKRRDGSVTYEPLRDAATSIATLNGKIAPDLAVKTVLSLASPVGFDDKGKPLPGMNGKTGAGATNYQVIGRDVRDNYLVVTNDGQHLRIDPDTMTQLRQARTMGYRAAKQWHVDQAKAAGQQDWLTRAWRSVIPGKGF